MKKLHAQQNLVKADYSASSFIYNTDWFAIDGGSYKKNGTFKEFAIQLAWSAVAGTANGTIEVLGTIDGLETVLSSTTINSTSNLADVTLLNIATVVNAIRLRITFNSITSFTFEADMEIYK